MMAYRYRTKINHTLLRMYGTDIDKNDFDFIILKIVVSLQALNFFYKLADFLSSSYSQCI